MKKGRRTRTIALDLSDEEDDMELELQKDRKQPKLSTSSKITSQPTLPKKPASRMACFDEEDDDEPLQLKKVKQPPPKKPEKQKKVSAAPRSMSPAPEYHSNYYGTADDYSKERLAQMRNEFVVRVAPTLVDDDGLDAEEQMMIAKDISSFSKTTSEVPASSALLPSVVGFGETPMDEDQGSKPTLIPSMDRIAELKQKRDRLRQMGITQKDYIALNSKEEENTSRLVREEDSDEDEEPEYDHVTRGARMQFGDPTKMGKKKPAMDSDDSEEEVSRKWEEEQLAKLGQRQIKEIAQDYAAKVMKTAPVQKEAPPYVPLPLTSIVKNIKDKINVLNSIHSEHKLQLQKLQENLVEAEHKKASFENESVSMVEEANFFRDLKDYCFDLMDCLDIKSQDLSKLEKNLFDLQMETFRTISNKKAQYLADELEQARDLLNGTKRTLIGEKEDLRKQRIELREKKRESRSYRNYDPEGWSSDDDEIGQQAMEAYFDSKDQIVNDTRVLLEDAYEDFSTLAPVLDRFESWKSKFPDSYKQAYGSLSLRKIAETYVKQELLVRWDMMALEPLVFPDLEWYQVLYDYGTAQEPKAKDEDDLLIPFLISNIVLDKVKSIMTNFYDPLSKSGTQKAIALLTELKFVSGIAFIQTKIKEIVGAAKVTLQNAVDHQIVLFPPDKCAPFVLEFSNRQFWSTLKLFTNLFKWTDFIQIDFLAAIGIDMLFNYRLLPFLKATQDTKIIEEACKKITAAIPNDFVTYLSPSFSQFKEFITSNYPTYLPLLQHKIR